MSADAAVDAKRFDLSVCVCLQGDLNCIAGATSRNGAFIWDVRKGKIITRFNEVTLLCSPPERSCRATCEVWTVVCEGAGWLTALLMLRYGDGLVAGSFIRQQQEISSSLC